MKKWFYVLELAGGRYYVGISNNLVRRARQHHEGKGAVWTKLHSPVNLLFQHEHDVPDEHAAYNLCTGVHADAVCVVLPRNATSEVVGVLDTPQEVFVDSLQDVLERLTGVVQDSLCSVGLFCRGCNEVEMRGTLGQAQ